MSFSIYLAHGSVNHNCSRWDDKAEVPKFALRQEQLHFRQLELYLGYAHLKEFVESSVDKDLGMLLHLIGVIF